MRKPTTEEVRDKIIDIITTQTGWMQEVDNDTSLRRVGADSLDLIEIEMEIEQAFGVNECMLETSHTVDDIVATIMKEVNERP